MKIIFAGTPAFAAVSLDALLEAGHEVVLVLTQPDRPAGRGLRLQQSPVKAIASARGLMLEQPATLKEAALLHRAAALEADAVVVAAYGLILPTPWLGLARLGAINIHASLLPRWRGAAPIQRALLSGDAETGITIMQMDEGLDTGAILLQEAIKIEPDDTAQRLHDKLAALGARLILKALRSPCVPRQQDPALATYAAKIEKSEARLDWQESASVLERKVRAFNPFPGAYFVVDGVPLKIWRAEVVRGVSAPSGTVCDLDNASLTVACGEDALRLLEVQRAGGKRLSTGAFLTGYPVHVGQRFEP
jgi:methionyl-tRNA formyltransferase